jgi:CheY-like chemotaxis protein
MRDAYSKPTEGSALKILVVDDNRDAALSMGRLLTALGNNVRVVHDGFSALDTAEAFRPDAVLLDIGLPEMDGYDTARMLRDIPECENLTIIAVTGWGQDSDKERGRLAGIDHHVLKPADSSTLIRLLSSATERPHDTSSALARE